MGTTAEPGLEFRDIRCTHSENLPELLAGLRLSILISTYQTGHLVVVTARQGRLVVTFHQFDRAMGIAVKPGTIAICTRKEVWFAARPRTSRPNSSLAGTTMPVFWHVHRTSPTIFMPTSAAWVGGEFWVVNTLFSCLAALHPIYSFAPRWRPPFVTALRPEDRCHLNGMAVVDGQPRYVTALAETDSPEGWRAVKATGGCLIEVPSGRIVVRGLALPHSPRVDGDQIFFLQSGNGALAVVDPRNGQVDTVAKLPGVVRGLALHGGFAFVGLSKARPTLEGVPHRGPARRVAMWPVGGGFDDRDRRRPSCV